MEKSFCEFLVDIGLIDRKISNNIKFINREITKSRKEFSFTDSFFISLMHFFNNLTINQKKYMCFSLPLRFVLLRQKELKQKLKSILFKRSLKEKIIKLRYLLRWIKGDKINFKIEKNNNFGDKENNDLLLDDDSGSIVLDDFIPGNKIMDDKINKFNNTNYVCCSNKKKCQIENKKNNSFNKSRSKNNCHNKAKGIITTSDRMELLQLSECTFKPTINITNNSYGNSNVNVDKKFAFMKLYQDSEKYRIKKTLKALEFEKIMNDNLTFKPHVCQTPKSVKNYKFDSFEERQKKFINNKKENTNKLKLDLEKNTASKCSFTPRINKTILDFNSSSVANVNYRNNLTNINITHSNHKYNLTNEEKKQNMNSNSKSNYKNTNNNYIGESYYSLNTVKSVPAHLRLYNDSQRRNSSFIQKENEYNKMIEEMANRTSNKFNKVNYDKLFDLYENKEGKANQEKTKQKVEREEGATFKPELCSNNKYIGRICNDFYERNKSCKKNIIFKEYEKFDNKVNNKKKFTDEQKKKIINNIVQRLYKEPMTKNSLQNNKSECNKYIKNYNYSNTSRNNIQNKNI